MTILSRRSFLRFTGRGATMAAASAAFPIGIQSAAAASAGIGNQTLRSITRKDNTNPNAILKLPIDPAVPGGVYKVIYSATMSNLQVGDTLQILAEVQGVNNSAALPAGCETPGDFIECLGTNIQLGTWVSLMKTAGGTVPSAPNNESYICPPSGANIMEIESNIGNHYGVPTRVGAVTVPTAGTWYVNVIGYGLSDAFSTPQNDMLVVRCAYSQLTVMLFR